MWAALIPLLLDWAFRLLVALGVTFASYEGLELLFDYFWQEVINSLGQTPQDFLGLFNLAGGGEAMNILVGAYTFVIGMKIGSKTVKFVGAGRK